MESRLSITAIVPTLLEESGITACLERLRQAGVDEIIVVDGGSTDATLDRARPLADLVVEGRRGLFHQLSEGARHANGDVLLFHYADSTLSPQALLSLRRALASQRVDGGAFRLGFDSESWFFRWVAFWAGVRNRLGLGPFGDQSLFVRSVIYHELGGFRTDRALADHELARQLRRRRRFRILPERVTTSTRRWEAEGRVRTLSRHVRISVAYVLGSGRARDRAKRDAGELRRVR